MFDALRMLCDRDGHKSARQAVEKSQLVQVVEITGALGIPRTVFCPRPLIGLGEHHFSPTIKSLTLEQPSNHWKLAAS